MLKLLVIKREKLIKVMQTCFKVFDGLHLKLGET